MNYATDDLKYYEAKLVELMKKAPIDYEFNEEKHQDNIRYVQMHIADLKEKK